MTRSSRDPYFRVPNFGIEGALPRPPWWADFDHWRIPAPASPPWAPPRPAPRDNENPFEPPADTAPPPTRRNEIGPLDSDLVDWLLGSSRGRPRSSVPIRPNELQRQIQEAPLVPLPGQPDEHIPSVPQNLPFGARERAALDGMTQILRLAGAAPSRDRGVQPPMFFPID